MTDDDYTTRFPLQSPSIKCGLRSDLPKKERRHLYVDAGVDTRNKGSRGYVDCSIRVCYRCGFDDAKELKQIG